MSWNAMDSCLTRRSWLAALGGLVLVSPFSAAAAADHSEFDGDWKLNRNESDDPKKKIEEAMKASGRGGRRRGLRGRAVSGRIEQAMERLSDASENITVRVEGDEFTVESGGRSRTFVANGETKRQQGERGSIEYKSQWQGGDLVTQARTSQGAEITSTYSLSGDAKKLHVVRKINSGQWKEPVVIRLVYDRKS